jgi:hypothetical protein
LASAQPSAVILLTSLRHVNWRHQQLLLQRIQNEALGRFMSKISAAGLTVPHKTVAELARK